MQKEGVEDEVSEQNKKPDEVVLRDNVLKKRFSIGSDQLRSYIRTHQFLMNEPSTSFHDFLNEGSSQRLVYLFHKPYV